MRINVYAEELTRECTYITKEVDGKRFYGIRLFLKSPHSLHHTEKDDDRSAITFWVPWVCGANQHETIINIFGDLTQMAWEARKNDECILREDAEGHIHLGNPVR